MIISKILDKSLRGVIFIASVITICILVTIVGYTVYKGMYSKTVSSWDVVPGVEDSVSLDGKEYVVVVNKKLKLNEISIDTLLSIKKGRVRTWGLITGQDFKVKLYSIIGSSLIVSDKAYKESSSDDIVRLVGLHKGAIGFVPVNDITRFPEAKILKIRRIALVVNDSVLQTVNNKRLRSVNSEDVFKILKGSVGNWKEFNGIDLPLRVVIPPETDRVFDGVNSNYDDVLYTAVNSIHTSSFEDFSRIIQNTEGAVAPVDYRVAKEMGLKILPVTQIDSGKNLTFDFITSKPKKSGKVGGVSTIILNTLIMIVLTMVFTVPVGVGAAVYLTMYSKENTMNSIIRTGIETLAGVPSIIFGLFGFIVFVEMLHLGVGLISGTLTISLMILPVIIRTSEESIKTVPKSFYEGSLAMGATKWQSIKGVVVPAASPGIISGVILGMGRAVGETAALLFTMGSDYRLVKDLTSSARVLSVHLYLLVKEGISFERGFAAATILILVILFMNLITTFFITRIGGLGGNGNE